MVAVDELLEPLSDDQPTGPDLSNGDQYAHIEKAYREADVPPSVSPTGADEGPGPDFSGVVDDATEFLRNESKDLKIAALLTGALLREEGFEGLAGGLELCGGLLERYWDDLHPGVSGRAAVLSWMGSEDVALALYQRPFTSAGHTYFHYKEWVQSHESEGGDADGDEGEASDELSGANFGQSFALTSRDWYEQLTSSLHRCTAALTELTELGEEKFADTEERPPRYRDLADSLSRVTTAADELLERKPAPPPATAEQMADDSGSGKEEGTEGADTQEATTAGGTSRPAAIEDPEAAAAAIATAARVLREADPSNPAAYLLLRGFRWGELRSFGETPEPRALVAPSTEQRTRLKSLFLDEEWESLLDTAEGIMATPAGRGWLDLQRYAILAAERIGGEYRRVAASIKGALQSLLRDVPGLMEATLMDDSAAASRDTLTWLQTQGIGPGGEGDAREEGGEDDIDGARAIREASFERAGGLVRAGDTQGAIELLMERAEHENSQRARFIVKSEIAEIMVEHGMKPVARPILDELHELIDAHKLETWEPGEVVAKPLGLLYRCLSSTDGQLQQQLYQRLAKLDPMLAMRVTEDDREGSEAGSASSAGGGTAKPEEEAEAPEESTADA